MLTHPSIWLRFDSYTTLMDIGSFPEKMIVKWGIPSETTKSWHHGGRRESDETSIIFCGHVNFLKMNRE